MELSPRNINPFTDFGFKKIFGEEATKELLLDFINSILSEETGEITSLEYSKNEHLGLGELDRKVVFDIYCITDKGERIIVEMQKAFQLNFKDRSLFYTTFPIRDQAIVGDWDYELKAVYCISILDFKLKDRFSEPDKFLHRIGLLDRDTGERFSSKLNFIYLEVPKFGLSEDELGTKFEKWVYLLKNLEYLQRLPDRLQDKIFSKVMDIAEIVKLGTKERSDYEDSLKNYRDFKSALSAQFDEGKMEGKMEGKIETAINLFNLGVAFEMIIKATNLEKDELIKILKEKGFKG